MLSTAQVADKSGVPFRTLTRWMALSKIRASTVFRQGTRQVHLWSDADVLKVRRYKREHFGEGRGRRTPQTAARCVPVARAAGNAI